MENQINNTRKEFEKLGTVYNKSENVTIRQEIIESVPCYWFKPEKTANTNRLIIYLHGGCFVLGSIESHRALVSHISENLALPILFVEYSLAPEKPFPAAVNEIERVYKHVLSRYPDDDIILMGDSAGGGLAVSVISDFNERGFRQPIYLVMRSPWVDLTCNNDSLLKNKDTDPILTKKALENYASMYVGDSTLPEADPIENMNGNYPPTLILVSSSEILLDDS